MAAWLAVLAVAIPIAPNVVGALRAGGFILDDLESARAKALLQAELARRRRRSSSSTTATTLAPGRPRSRPRPRRRSATSPSAPYVVRVVPPHPRPAPGLGRSAKPPTTCVPVDRRPTTRRPRCRGSLERLAQPPGIDVELAGGPAFYGDVQSVSESDLRRSEIISLPLAAMALLIVFGSVVAAGVPLVVGGAAVLVALAAIFVIASLTPDEHLRAQPRDAARSRARRRLLVADDEPLSRGARARAGPDEPDRVADAVVATVATAGRAVFFSGLTVLLGLIGLVLFEFMILRSVGIAGADRRLPGGRVAP